jgi:hypothetical protein
LRDPQKEQGGNLIRKLEKKKRRGKKCKEANPLLKCPSEEIPEQGPPREVLPTPIPVNNALVSWNCRGLGNPSKAEAVKDLLKIESPEILMLQETKIEGETLLEINKLKWKKNAGKAISARGSSGGLATLWSEDKFHLESSFETQHWIFTELRHYFK